MTTQFFIYGLTDPRTGEVRYVGKSATGMKRPKLHGKPSCLAKDETHKANWIRSLLAQGIHYVVEVLQYVGSREELNSAERYWIREARNAGWKLTNHTDGGDGLSGATFSAEHRANISKANRGRKLTAEQKARCSVAARRRDPATGAARVHAASLAWKGSKHTEEAKKAIGAVHRGKVVSAEARAKVSVANSKPVRELASSTMYPSVRAAATALGIECSGVAKVASGRARLKSHHGYRFEYVT